MNLKVLLIVVDVLELETVRYCETIQIHHAARYYETVPNCNNGKYLFCEIPFGALRLLTSYPWTATL